MGPANRLLIAPVNRLAADRPPDSARRVHARRAGRPAGPQITEQDGTPYGMSREFFLSPEGRPCLSPPWGELVAVQGGHRRDRVARDARRPERAGELPRGVPAPTGSTNLGGPAVVGRRRRSSSARPSIPTCARSQAEGRQGAVEDAAADERPRDAARLHDAERAARWSRSSPAGTTRRSRSRARRCTSSRCRRTERTGSPARMHRRAAAIG